MSRLTRRALALGLAALPLPALAQKTAPALSAADHALVSRATTYLQGLNEAKGRFVQTDPWGAVTQGSIYLKRPGKARFDYEPPSGLLVVSDGALVSIHDKRLKTFESYPLQATPLALFLARQIRLDQGVVITRVTRLADGFSITARDGKKEAEGQITLTFSDNPMSLVGWTVTDAQGQSTRIRLTGLTRASGLASSLFVLKDPRPKNVGRGRV
ncbi:MAG: outer-membrane lipoprotein carrier protein LolA [Phenylobacterium sp.]|nr:outer-membrane lipoprotein carrier protein LolA [Phenylobacterium sp.]